MKTDVKFSSPGNNIVAALIIILTVCCPVKLFQTSDCGNKPNMAPDSVDDQFIGCDNNMFDLIKDKILPEELKNDGEFNNAWTTYNNTQNYFERIIKVHTSHSGSYSRFTDAVRKGRPGYKNIKYKAYHFLLTRAVQMYRVKECTTVLHRTNVNNFDLKEPEIRFGRFASSSLKNDLVHFGRNCFKITTCFGADIASMSVYPDEKEVLIPPYEKFKLTNIEGQKMNCSAIYTLQSDGVCSNMNCELLKK